MSAVVISSSAIFKEHLPVYCPLYWKHENKEKEAMNGPFKNVTGQNVMGAKNFVLCTFYPPKNDHQNARKVSCTLKWSKARCTTWARRETICRLTLNLKILQIFNWGAINKLYILNPKGTDWYFLATDNLTSFFKTFEGFLHCFIWALIQIWLLTQIRSFEIIEKNYFNFCIVCQYI